MNIKRTRGARHRRQRWSCRLPARSAPLPRAAPKPKADRGPSTTTSPARRPRSSKRSRSRPATWSLKGKAKATGKNKVVKVAKGQFVELAFEGEDQILTLLGRVRRRRPTTTHPGHPPHNGDAGPAAQQDPEARPERRQHDDLDRGLQPEPLRQPALQQGAEPVDGELVPRAVVRPLQRRRLRQRLGRRSRTTRLRTAATTAAASSARATSGASWSTRRSLVGLADRRRQ